MSACVPYGKCHYCENESVLLIKYFYFDIDCTCCKSVDKLGNNTHFVRVEHCKECLETGKVIAPGEVKVYIQSDKYLIENKWEAFKIKDLQVYDIIVEDEYIWYMVESTSKEGIAVGVKNMTNNLTFNFDEDCIKPSMKVYRHEDILDRIRPKSLTISLEAK